MLILVELVAHPLAHVMNRLCVHLCRISANCHGVMGYMLDAANNVTLALVKHMLDCQDELA